VDCRVGHSLLFPLFAIHYSATLSPLFAITTPLLFLIVAIQLLLNQCFGRHHFEGLNRQETDLEPTPEPDQAPYPEPDPTSSGSATLTKIMQLF
jgi:hypothetical protein